MTAEDPDEITDSSNEHRNAERTSATYACGCQTEEISEERKASPRKREERPVTTAWTASALVRAGFADHGLVRPSSAPSSGAPAGFEPAHTAPEAARVIARTLALTCADCTNGGGGSGGRSAHVPDHHLSGLG